MSRLKAYRQQSVLTDPGEYAALYDDLPDDIGRLCRIARGLIAHYSALGGSRPEAERLHEIDSRYATVMLRRILELDERPLAEERRLNKRLLGCCRDLTVLLVSILRHKGVPARARYGGAAYFEAGYFHDHVIIEYWDGERWVGLDSQLSPKDVRALNIRFDPLDLPADQFLRGGAGWLACREGAADPNRFGLGSQSPLRGWPILVTETLLDLAALNRRELLCWDSWGLAANSLGLSEADNKFLDNLARATLDEARGDEWASLLQDERLRIPPVIDSYSPAVSPEDMPLRVELAPGIVTDDC